VVAPLRGVPGAGVSEAGRDRLAALYDRALRLAHLEHPALPRLVESMAPELPDPFLAWRVPPRLDSARALLDRRALGLARALRVALGVAEALQVVHAAGEVHGGICPANVLAGEDDRVALLGVGLSTPRSALGAATVSVARYRAPEQLSLARGAIDPRTDVFGLGVLLYELVNSEPAFPGDTLDSVRVAMASSPPESIGFRFGDPGGTLPEPLDRALRTALRPDPSARFRTVAELARCLEELLDVLEPGRRTRRSRLPSAEAASHRATPLPRSTPRALADRRLELARSGEPVPLALWLVPAALLLALAAALALWVL
jgi:serine/threonine-protein kinase